MISLKSIAQPSIPLGLTAVKAPKSIALSWNQVIGTGIYYQVYRGTTSSGKTLYKDSLSSNSYIDTGAIAGNIYFYAIKAFNVSGYSSLSAEVQQSSNRIFFVSTNGNNGNIGSESSPFLSAAYAISQTVDGDTVVVLPGTYSERLNFSGKSIVFGSKYLTTADTSYISSTKLDGFNIANSGTLVFESFVPANGLRALVGFTITRSKTSALSLSNFIIRRMVFDNNGLNDMTFNNVIHLYNSSTMDSSVMMNHNCPTADGLMYLYNSSSGFYKIAIRNNRFINNTLSLGGIVFNHGEYSGESYFENNVILKMKGIYYRGAVEFRYLIGAIVSQKFFCRNNVISKTNMAGVNLEAAKNPDSIFIVNNTITENIAGIQINADLTCYSRYVNNVLAWNGNSTQFKHNFNILNTPIFPTHKSVFKNNIIGDQGIGSAVASITNYDLLNIIDSTGNIISEPMFRDTSFANADYRLLNNSKLIAKGILDQYMLNYDILGNIKPAPSGSSPEPGAYELNTKYIAPVLNTVEAGDKKVTLFWSPSASPGLTTYRIIRSTGIIADTATIGVIVSGLSIATLSYTDTNSLNNLVPYHYRIQATDASGSLTGLSNELICTPRIPPSKVLQFTAIKSPRKIQLLWQPVTGTGITYQIFKGTSKSNLSLFKDNLLDVKFTDTSASPYTNYFYSVRAVDPFSTKGSFSDTILSWSTRIWFVDTAGNNNYLGSEDSSFQTIAACINVIQDGDTIILKPGTFKERINFGTKAFTLASRYILNGDTSFISKTIIDGSNAVNTAAVIFESGSNSIVKSIVGVRLANSRGQFIGLSNVIVRRVLAEYNLNSPPAGGAGSLFTLSGFFILDSSIIRNNNSAYYFINTVPSSTNKTCEIRNNIFKDNKYEDCGIYFWGSSISGNTILVENNTFTGYVRTVNAGNTAMIRYYGIGNTGGQKFIFRNNLIAKNYSGGIYTDVAPNDSVYIINNTIVQNVMPGIGMNSGTNGNTWIVNNIINNISGANDEVNNAGTNTQTHKAHFINNIIGSVKNPYSLLSIPNISYFNISDTSRNFAVWPNFIDTGMGLNYRLANNSQAIGNGILYANLPNTDFTGSPRVQPANSPPDLGAFESKYYLIAPDIDSLNTNDSRVRITWLNYSSGITKYLVYRSVNGGSLNYLKTINAPAQLFIDSFPVLTKVNEYAIIAVNNLGDSSGIGNLISGLPLAFIVTSNPVNKAVLQPLSLNLKWLKDSLASTYRIQIATDSTFSSGIIKDTTTSDSSYSLKNLTYNKIYYWRVRGQNKFGFSGWPNITSFQTILRNVRIDSIATSHQKVFIKWSDSSATGISKYIINKTDLTANISKKDSVNGGIYSYTDLGLVNDHLYKYEIEPVNLQGVIGNKSVGRQAIPLSAPNPISPANNSVSPTRLPVLIWNKNQFAINYRCQVSLRSQFDTLVYDTIRTDTTFSISKILKPNSYYYWRVLSKDSLGISNYSSTFGFQTEMSIPYLAPLTTGDNSIKLNWVDTGSVNTSKYYIYRSNSPGASILIDSINSGTFSWTDNNTINGVQYFYRIRTLNNQGILSSFSNERNTAPYSPIIGITVEKGPWRNMISWNNVPITGARYQLFRGNVSGNLSLIKDSLTATSFLDTNVVAGGTYYYALRSIDVQYNPSILSNETKVIPNQVWYIDSAVITNGYGGAQSPFKLISSAIDLAHSFDTIILAKGSYNERIDFNGKKITLASQFIFSGINSVIDSTIIDGNNLGVQAIISDSKSKGYNLIGIHITRASQIAINSAASSIENTNIISCRISNSGSTAITGVVNVVSGNILNSKFTKNAASTLLTAGSNIGKNKVTINRCLFESNLITTSVVNAGYARIYNSVFMRNSGGTIISHTITGNSTDTNLVAIHNTISLNNSSGIQVGGAITSVIDNNISAFNKTQMEFSGITSFATIRMRNNIIQGLNSLNFPGTFTVFKSGNMDTIPAFTDTTSGNLTLANYSSGIGKAASNINVGNDYNNNNRPSPSGSTNDIGAFENEFAFSGPYLDSAYADNGKVILKWTTANTDNFSFKVYRSSYTNADQLLFTLPASVLSLTDTGASDGITYYYRIIATNSFGISSGYSNEKSILIPGKVDFHSPTNNDNKVSLKPYFNWKKGAFTNKYAIQISTSSSFSSLFIDTILLDTQATFNKSFTDNKLFYARIKCINKDGSGKWSNIIQFKTRLIAPVLDSVIAGNHNNKLYFTHETSGGVARYRLLRDTSLLFVNPIIAIETSDLSKRIIIDSPLINNRTYYYKLLALNIDSISGDTSNIKSGMPFNRKPNLITLKEVRLNGQGRRTSVAYNFSSFGSVDTDGKIDSLVWFVNGKRIKSDTSLNYGFRQGTSLVTLKAWDNDGASDSTFTFIHINLFEYTLNGPIVGGLTAANNNKIYVADDFFRTGLGYEITLLDSLGIKNNSKSIGVNFRTLTTPSITPEKSVLITNGLNLNGFDVNSDAQFGAIQLSRTTSVTPTIDSMLNRMYVGDDGGNFKAYNYKTGGAPIWSYTADDSISSSAVLTRDRKLIFPTVSGKLYGFSVRTSNSQGSPASPKWQYTIGDKVNNSPAIDTAGNIYLGTRNGKLVKINLHDTGGVELMWSKQISTGFISSPVIDASGFVYIGGMNGVVYKLNPINGTVVWQISTGAQILATPAISNYGIIYVSNSAGLLTALDTLGRLKWFYKDSSGIDANILHVKGTTYIGTKGGKVIAFWDKDLLTFGKAENSTEPVWGTFQGNGQRTGTQFGPVDTTNSDTTRIGIQDIETPANKVIVYPNPVENILHVKSDNDDIKGIELVDLQGKIYLKTNESEMPIKSKSIDLSEFTSGIYIIRIITENSSMTYRIFINH